MLLTILTTSPILYCVLDRAFLNTIVQYKVHVGVNPVDISDSTTRRLMAMAGERGREGMRCLKHGTVSQCVHSVMKYVVHSKSQLLCEIVYDGAMV